MKIYADVYKWIPAVLFEEKNDLDKMRRNRMNDTFEIKYLSGGNGSEDTHSHDCHQILVVANGTALLSLNGTERTIAEGDVVAVSRFEEHSVSKQSADYTRYILRIAPNYEFQCESRPFVFVLNCPQFFDNVINLAPGELFDETKRLLGGLLAEYGSENKMRAEMLSHMLNEFLIRIYRCINIAQTDIDTASFDVICNVMKYLSRNLRDAHTLESVAQHFSVSVSYLSHNFRKTSGISVMKYLQMCRIAEAKRMLAGYKTSGCTVGDVAEACGFTDFSNFCRTFKAVTGYTPSRYAAVSEKCDDDTRFGTGAR